MAKFLKDPREKTAVAAVFVFGVLASDTVFSLALAVIMAVATGSVK